MEEKKYKKNAIKIIILFIIAFIFIMVLPELRSMIKIKQYEKKQQILIDKKEEEEETTEKKKTLNTIICSIDTNDSSYQLSYDNSGLKKYVIVTNTEIIDKTEEEIKTELDSCEKENEKNEKGIETKCDYTNDNFTKSVTYDYTVMSEAYRKENIFEFNYNESVTKIRTNLENKGYTCG